MNKMTGQPEKRVKVGLVQATIWKNTSSSGEEFKTVSLNKSYLKDGEWKNTSSFSFGDIDKAIEVLQQASDYLNNQSGDEIIA